MNTTTYFQNHCNVEILISGQKGWGTKQIVHMKSSPIFSSSKDCEKKEENITELWGKKTQHEYVYTANTERSVSQVNPKHDFLLEEKFVMENLY